MLKRPKIQGDGLSFRRWTWRLQRHTLRPYNLTLGRALVYELLSSDILIFSAINLPSQCVCVEPYQWHIHTKDIDHRTHTLTRRIPGMNVNVTGLTGLVKRCKCHHNERSWAEVWGHQASRRSGRWRERVFRSGWGLSFSPEHGPLSDLNFKAYLLFHW